MAQVNYHNARDPLSLDNIRNTLIRLEDTIIFALIERAQFAHNPKIYARGAFPSLSETQHYQGSWLDWFLKETESFHGESLRTVSDIDGRREIDSRRSEGKAVQQVSTARALSHIS